MFEVVWQNGLGKFDLIMDNKGPALTRPADQGAIGLIVDQLPQFVQEGGRRPGCIGRRDGGGGGYLCV